MAALYLVDLHSDRPSSYPHYSLMLNFDGIDFPMTLRNIARLECLNDVSINVFAIREKRKRNGIIIVPLLLTGNKKSTHMSTLFLLEREIGRVECGRANDCAVILSSEDDKLLSFRNHDKKERLRFVMYADLECILEKGDQPLGISTIDSPINTTRRSAWDIICVALLYPGWVTTLILGIVGCRSGYNSTYNGIISAYRSRRGDDCVWWFVEELRALACRVRKVLCASVLMSELTPDKRSAFQKATNCHVCGRSFGSYDIRVRDHCHLTGRCSHAFEDRVDLLPLTKKNYIAFSKIVNDSAYGKWKNCVKLRFVDSFKFLNTSLEKVASYLDREKLRISRFEFSDLIAEDFELFTRKGIFPYEYIDSADKLLETELSPIEAFHSSLTGETVSVSDYEHARRVWERFRVRTLGEYSDLYLKTDVLLLERGIRGGLSQCSNRYARANNQYESSYDSSQPSYLMYYDVNNLYGWAMCEPYRMQNFGGLRMSKSSILCPSHLTPISCVRYGLRVTKVYRALWFAQSPWLRAYIELNTERRTRTSNEFERNLYKLMNNAVFGKTMENVRDYVDVRLVTRWNGRYGTDRETEFSQ
ncbi:uncharacterized protein LOC105431471 [Pogonomyrmex barbatus]|uniref:Uncharacterized protein LOC105431471 n=1 Tax=Pogonomyrmex barbatus TaxID=144034 RepID=A0A6I9XFF7_9HYME|nr:uncharacterized protein LOC105431471 [Pogonomyrmex barbatus]